MKQTLPRRALATTTAFALALTGALVASQPAAAADSRLVAHYPLTETTGTTAADVSGAGRNASYVGGPGLTGGEGVRLDGTDDYVDLPDNLLAGLDSITISADVLVRGNQSTPYFIYGLGNTDSAGVGNGYLYSTGNTYKTSIATGNWTTEQTANSNANLQRDVWKTITYTLDDATDTARAALQTAQVAQATAADLDRYLVRLPNLYDRYSPNHLVDQYMDENGTVAALPGYTVGPFERVKPGTVHTANNKQFVTFFDENFQPVGGVRFDRPALQFQTTADTAFIRPTLPISEKGNFQIVEGSAVPTSYSPYGRRTAANLVVSSKAATKRILWLGTSIPAGSGYAEQACGELGASCINMAVPSSSVRILDKNNSRAGMHWQNCAYALAHTIAEKNDLLTNWATYRTQFVNAASAPVSFTSEEATYIRNCSYEARLVPYLNGEQPPVDLIVFSHGYNDPFSNESAAEFTTMPADFLNRSTYLGAANYIFQVINYYRPGQKVVIEGHFENQLVTRVAQGQQVLADYWQYPVWKLWEKTGWSQRVIPNTAAKWAQTPWSTYAADAEAREPGSTNQDMKALRYFLPDNVHPYSDPTGAARDTLARLIRNHLNETF